MQKEKLITKLKKEIKLHKRAFIIYIILRLLVIITLVLQLLNGNYENAFLCILTLVLFLIPSLIELRFKIEMPETLEIIIFLFIFAAEILGEIQNFYNVFTNWDTILHTMNGFLCAAIGFSLIDILNRIEKLHWNLSPLFVAIVGFCFSMTIGVLWEFFEYGVDKYLGYDMQKDQIVTKISSVSLNEDGQNITIKIENIDETIIIAAGNSFTIKNGYLDIGLNDTMADLFVNFLGALIYCVIGYIYVKRRDDNSLAHKFILKIKE